MEKLKALFKIFESYLTRGFDGKILVTFRHGQIQKAQKLEEDLKI